MLPIWPCLGFGPNSRHCKLRAHYNVYGRSAGTEKAHEGRSFRSLGASWRGRQHLEAAGTSGQTGKQLAPLASLDGRADVMPDAEYVGAGDQHRQRHTKRHLAGALLCCQQ